MSCDYTDVIIPVDYTISAFKYANRKNYGSWKMIGMQVSHGTVGGIKLDPNNYTTYDNGIITGCMPIEEINQNNHIVGRGAYYFRAKSDGMPGTNSATYGIMGHCNTPGVEYATPSDVKPDIGHPGAWEIEGSDFVTEDFRDVMKPTPWFRGWGVPQSWDKCSTMNALEWRVGYFVRNNQTGFSYMVSWANKNCSKVCGDSGPECYNQCKSENAQLPGRFSPWKLVNSVNGGKEQYIYRNCEALTYDFDMVGHGVDSQPERNNSACYSAQSPGFTYNDILGVSGYAPLDYAVGGGAHLGVIIKLTSLPSCTHFEKLIQIDDKRPSKIKDPNYCIQAGADPFTSTRYPVNPLTNLCDDKLEPVFIRNVRCERAVIRISTVCSYAWRSSNIYKRGMIPYKVREYHYDRWDRSDDGNYKLFDEIYEIPESNLTVRVLAANTKIWEYYEPPEGFDRLTDPINKETGLPYSAEMGDPSVSFLKKDWFKKKFLTGGGIKDLPSGAKGCRCENPKDGDEGYYPFRPYNEFIYCPNNFSCEKTCNG